MKGNMATKLSKFSWFLSIWLSDSIFGIGVVDFSRFEGLGIFELEIGKPVDRLGLLLRPPLWMNFVVDVGRGVEVVTLFCDDVDIIEFGWKLLILLEEAIPDVEVTSFEVVDIVEVTDDDDDAVDITGEEALEKTGLPDVVLELDVVEVQVVLGVERTGEEENDCAAFVVVVVVEVVVVAEILLIRVLILASRRFTFPNSDSKSWRIARNPTRTASDT